MKRLKDELLGIITEKGILTNKKVLEIGCGTGTRSKQIAQRCESLTAIDSDEASITSARQTNFLDNIEYSVGQAQQLQFEDNTFDSVIFTLSLHHVPIYEMDQAITDAVRVTKKGGRIVVFEPFYSGTFFDAELLFDASDGDERKEKAYAYYVMLNSHLLKELEEIYDETILQFESYEDFLETMQQKKNLNQLRKFLEQNKYILTAKRRINIFDVNKLY